MILTINAGSSSVKLGAFTVDGGGPRTSLIRLAVEKDEDASRAPADRLQAFLARHAIRTVDAVAHRVVHGGARFSAPAILDEESLAALRDLVPLAPLHMPPAIAWIDAARASLPTAKQVAVFDTAFFHALPAVATTYAIPRALAASLGIRRYGFHGLAHQAMWRALVEERPELAREGRAISLQLGAGCSAAAVRGGVPVDTSMGFSPLEGLVMATRGGDLDPGALVHMLRAGGLTVDAVDDLLNHESGLEGLAGDADMRRVLARSDEAARLAVEIYCMRARKYLGAYLAVLGGCDAILLGGGVGEHAAIIRARILEDLEWAGLSLDRVANDAAPGFARITREASRVAAYVIPVDEESVLAEEARAASMPSV